MSPNDVAEWFTQLTDETLLAVYDVALDIRDELQNGGEVLVPIYRQVARFAPLCPAFSAGFVDGYCDFRWKASLLLKKHGAVAAFDIINGPYRWDGTLRFQIDTETFQRHFQGIEETYQTRFRGDVAGYSLLGRSMTGDPLELLRSLFLRFHDVALQLRERYGNRPTLEVSDERDVRDLLHALLKLHFDDVRPQEWSPGYAGNSSSMDFFLKSEKIVVEVKRTRPDLGAREMGEELISDRERYANMLGCDTLICFVYDPENSIGNAAWVESELSVNRDNFKVEVIIAPKRY
ncbi:MAG TPA: hypothetical protein VMJ66_06040 [Geobacteraceae bacterium]|nr:hypothetical protein [Geobacteraceae bacterium]